MQLRCALAHLDRGLVFRRVPKGRGLLHRRILNQHTGARFLRAFEHRMAAVSGEKSGAIGGEYISAFALTGAGFLLIFEIE